MNSYLFSAITLCLAAQCALAQYQSANSAGYGNGASNGYQQRKLAPSPQTYGNQQQASGYGAGEASHYAEPQYPPMPFAWGYDINDGYGGAQFHKENGDEYGKRTGSYGYTDAYGIYRQVDYIADENGFRATIKTNEPGTSNESPADVEMHAYEPPSNYYAGNSGYSSGNSGYSSGNSGSSYGSSAGSSYAATAAAPVAKMSSYAAPAASAYNSGSSYGAQSSGAASYSMPRATSTYNNVQRSSGYSARPQASSGYGAASSGYGSSGYGNAGNQRSSYEQANQYSGSAMVPVYQRSKQMAAKHY